MCLVLGHKGRGGMRLLFLPKRDARGPWAAVLESTRRGASMVINRVHLMHMKSSAQRSEITPVLFRFTDFENTLNPLLSFCFSK